MAHLRARCVNLVSECSRVSVFTRRERVPRATVASVGVSQDPSLEYDVSGVLIGVDARLSGMSQLDDYEALACSQTALPARAVEVRHGLPRWRCEAAKQS